MRLRRAIALSVAVWLLIAAVALAVAGCGPDAGRVYCPTPQHGEACGPSPTVHPAP
jgi:hypothetical protein